MSENSEPREGIRDFMEKLSLRQERGIITEQEYRHLITESRLTLTELDTIDSLAEKHVLRARKALGQQKYETAVSELERAVILTPLDIGRRCELGEAYLKRYEGRGYLVRDLERASGVVHDILTLKPSSPEGQKLKRKVEEAGGVFSRPGKKSRNWILPVIIMLLLLVILSWAWRKDFSLPGFLAGLGNRRGDTPVDNPPLPAPEMPTYFTPKPETNALKAADLDFNLVTSEAKISRGAWVYDLRGTVTPLKEEYSLLILEIRWPGENPTLVKEIPLVTVKDPPARPGDELVLDVWLFLPVPPDPESPPVLTIKRKESEKPSPPPKPGTLPLHRAKPLPEGVSLEIAVRQSRWNEGYDRFYGIYDLEISNTGYKPLNYLELELTGYRKGPEPSASSRFYPVPDGGVPLEPGSRRLVRTVIFTPVNTPPDTEDMQLILHDSASEDGGTSP